MFGVVARYAAAELQMQSITEISGSKYIGIIEKAHKHSSYIRSKTESMEKFVNYKSAEIEVLEKKKRDPTLETRYQATKLYKTYKKFDHEAYNINTTLKTFLWMKYFPDKKTSEYLKHNV
uniref:Uncharacterized protein n=1 Tax=Romanomermis culicivorax TaxID=13658 RepID=A0A915HTI9_ROMCU